MTWPAPTRADHERFCEREGWERVRDARGRRVAHHVTYKLLLPDGRTLRTGVSHPPDRTAYSPALWGHILRDQLEVTEAEFWACVRDGQMPNRGRPVTHAEPLPSAVAYMLIHRVGLSEEEVAGMTKDEAIARVQKFWSGEG